MFIISCFTNMFDIHFFFLLYGLCKHKHNSPTVFLVCVISFGIRIYKFYPSFKVCQSFIPKEFQKFLIGGLEINIFLSGYRKLPDLNHALVSLVTVCLLLILLYSTFKNELANFKNFTSWKMLTLYMLS